jgi:hypothetical protein
VAGDDTWTATDRGGTTRGLLLGNAIGLPLYAAAYVACPTLHVADAVDARIAFALWLCAAPALFVYAAFFSCLRLRDAAHEAVNPLLGGESLRWKVNQRVLTNSVEQAAIFIPVLVALATRIDAAHVQLLPVSAGAWVASRIAFWIGYRKSPSWRAPGMAWTHTTTLLTIAWLVVFSL